MNVAEQQDTKYDKLIYGKNPTEKIVGIEVIDNQAELYVQDETGDVEVFTVPNKYWLLSSSELGNNCQKLKGNLHYKYGKRFESRKDFLKFRRMYKNQDCFSIYDAKESLMVKDGYTYFKDLKLSDVSCLAFDLETTGIEHNDDSKILLISNSFRKNGKVVKRLFAYDEYPSQGAMLVDWCTWVRAMDPSVLLGHNIMSFDIPYLKFIADNEEVELQLGRDHNASPIHIETDYESKFRIDGSRDQHYHKVKCHGRELIDTFFLSVKYDMASKKYESYALKKIIQQEGLEKPNRQMYDASQIRFNYKDPIEWKKIKAYCIDDADDALALYDLMAPPFFYLTQSIPKSFQTIIESATGSQINSLLLRSYIQEGHSIPKASPPIFYQGATSFAIPGVYRNLYKVDIKSCYPSAILIYNIYDKQKDPDGNFLKFMKYFTNQRYEYKRLFKETKNPMYLHLDTSSKFLINSGYGFLGAAGLSFNSPELAEKVTRYGREFLNKAILWASGKPSSFWIEKLNES